MFLCFLFNWHYSLDLFLCKAFRKHQKPVASVSFNSNLSGDIPVTMLSISVPPCTAQPPLQPLGNEQEPTLSSVTGVDLMVLLSLYTAFLAQYRETRASIRDGRQIFHSRRKFVIIAQDLKVTTHTQRRNLEWISSICSWGFLFSDSSRTGHGTWIQGKGSSRKGNFAQQKMLNNGVEWEFRLWDLTRKLFVEVSSKSDVSQRSILQWGLLWGGKIYY